MRFKAKALGIRKIDVYDAGGRILFEKEPNIDPMTIISLIQSKPQKYKLDGQDKLRFITDMPEAEDRIEQLETLLAALSVGAR
jgi:transcription-repair coupling factor (superfamily II helicase)